MTKASYFVIFIVVVHILVQLEEYSLIWKAKPLTIEKTSKI